MRILTVDVGTGTQDIFLYDSRLAVENGFKMVMPSPTMLVNRQIKMATRSGSPVVLTGTIMGGGPSQWAAEEHIRAGFPVYATPSAALSFNDDLEKVKELGIQVISEDEERRLPAGVERVTLRDFDFNAIQQAFGAFGVDLDDLAAVVIGVFDHGAAPPDISDRQFRFDYLDERIRAKNRLSAFAYRAEDIPPIMTRLQAVAGSARGLDVPLVVMDTAPAAVLGAQFDPVVQGRKRVMIANIGNFHTLAFRFGSTGKIEAVFEHHTGLLDREKVESLLVRLADGSLTHADVFGSMGHGALVYSSEPLALDQPDYNVVVTGPRRSMMRGSRLRPYFAAPFGDMMIAGCFGLLSACADLLPELSETVRAGLERQSRAGVAPWDADESD